MSERATANHRIAACTGPPLHETLRLLAPLAPTLEELHLSGNNKTGGTITTDIVAFTKLAKLGLIDVGLEGAECPHILHLISQSQKPTA